MTRGHYEAQLDGKIWGDIGQAPVPVPVTFRWERANPLAVTLIIRQPKNLGGDPVVTWVFGINLLREVFKVPRGTTIGEGDVRVTLRGLDLQIDLLRPDKPEVKPGLLVLQPAAIEYILNRVGLQPVEEEAIIATEIDIFLYGIQHPEGTEQ